MDDDKTRNKSFSGDTDQDRFEQTNQDIKRGVNSSAEDYLSGISYPCTKADLIAQAQYQGADDGIISALDSLPDQDFDSPAEVVDQLGRMS